MKGRVLSLSTATTWQKGGKGDSRGPHDSFQKQRETRITAALSRCEREIAMSAATATQPRSKAERIPQPSEDRGGSGA